MGALNKDEEDEEEEEISARPIVVLKNPPVLKHKSHKSPPPSCHGDNPVRDGRLREVRASPSFVQLIRSGWCVAGMALMALGGGFAFHVGQSTTARTHLGDPACWTGDFSDIKE